jgi:hypothetical protein
MKAAALRPSTPPLDAVHLELALLRARAARLLLTADADSLELPILEPGEDEKNIRDWIQDFAFTALDAALADANAARRSLHGPGKWDAAPKRKTVA